MSVYLHTDVTAVKIHRNVVLAGVGSFAYVFDQSSGRVINRLSCLNGQNIYGFVPSKSGREILVFGGKQFTVIHLEEKEGTIVYVKLFEPVVCDDWLHSGIWINETSIVLLTAHNVLQYWTTMASLQSRQPSTGNSILYSGLLHRLEGDKILVLAGTVYSEVIVHCGGEVLQLLKGHKGVIFSISCDLTKGTIVTTSDDRSVRIWSSNLPVDFKPSTLNFWSKADIVCKHELYGHTARVMRCCTAKSIVSVGEDSAICFWDYDGTLLKKVTSHQNSSIWSVDADDNVVVTGGGDGAVVTHPLSKTDNLDTETIKIDKPKQIFITARNNFVILNENSELIHVNVKDNAKTQHKLDHSSTYKILSLSSCKQMIAISDMNGKLDVFVEICKGTAALVNLLDTKLDIGKVLSMDWIGNRHVAFVNETGKITVLAMENNKVDIVTEFQLPKSKDMRTTAADKLSNTYVFGDRCGNIHIYKQGKKDPFKSFDKIHGSYGPTSIKIRKNEIVSTGRKGTIKYCAINDDNIKHTYTKDLEFQWIEKFLDKDENLVCGFQERVFVVYDMKNDCNILEVPCGGGHRSWDAARYFDNINNKFEEMIMFVYLKNNEININRFVLSKIISKNIVHGSHGKEINTLKTFKYDNTVIFISGGEDTTLRISTLQTDFKDIVKFKHLSNLRTLKTLQINENKILLVSGGGRAQICAKIINFQQNNYEIDIEPEVLTDYMIKGVDKGRKNNQDWRNNTIDFDPETRIMDLDILEQSDHYKIYAGCSDAFLRVFKLANLEKPKLELIDEIKHHTTCLLKTLLIKYLNYDILITTTTRGDVAIWDTDLVTLNAPIFEMKANKSGINSICTKTLENKLIIATGGDDNAIHLFALELSDQRNLESIKVQDTLVLDKNHSSQITGLLLEDKYLLSTSIDQRVTLFKWIFCAKLQCEFVSQMCCDIADVQGMDLVCKTSKSLTVCVYGKGVELVEVQLPT